MARRRGSRGAGADRSGVEGPSDIDAVMDAFATKGVRQEGVEVGLVWGVRRDAHGREMLEATTTLHVAREPNWLNWRAPRRPIAAAR